VIYKFNQKKKKIKEKNSLYSAGGKLLPGIDPVGQPAHESGSASESQ
jgi:hypothetical protein